MRILGEEYGCLITSSDNKNWLCAIWIFFGAPLLNYNLFGWKKKGGKGEMSSTGRMSIPDEESIGIYIHKGW